MRRGAAALLLLAASGARAHKASDAYLVLESESKDLRGAWEVGLRDLELAIGLDADGDGAITWGELRAAQDRIASLLLSRLDLAASGKSCVLQPEGILTDRRADGAVAVLRFSAACSAPTFRLDVDYRLLFDQDPLHRGLVRLRGHGKEAAAVFSPDRERQTLDLGGGWAQAASFLREGVAHIFSGVDHVLFLLALLLPAVLRREGSGWRPVESWRPALRETLLVVSAFTAAHSITLSLAVLELVRLPSRWVESAIALSVLLAALNNLVPLFRGRQWAFAFGFGLLHGFGFAGALAELGLPATRLAAALVAFNLGVEAGQLAIVSAALSLAYAVRRTRAYPRLGLAAGSAAIAVLSATWLVERALQIHFPILRSLS